MQAYHEIWNDSWKFFKHYASRMPLPDNEWTELINMLPKFVARHPEHEKFARKMILTIEKELETIYKAMTQEGHHEIQNHHTPAH